MNPLRKYDLVVFFVLTYALTYGLSALGTSSTLIEEMPRYLRTTALLLLHYMPSAVAVLLVGLAAGKTGLVSLMRRLSDWRVGWGWYIFVLFYPISLRLVAAGINYALGGGMPAFFQVADSSIPRGNPLILLLPVFLAVLFQAGIAEEIGWRGFALPRLQERFSALTSSLILGLTWALWHFHPQNIASLLPVAHWYILGTLCSTVVFTWVYNNTRGSLWIAILFHTAINTSAWIVPIDPAVAQQAYPLAFLALLTIQVLFTFFLVLAFGPQHLSRRRVEERRLGATNRV